MFALKTSSASISRPTVRPVAVRAPLRRVAVASPVSTQALPIEIAQVAGEASFIAGTAFTMMGITLIGLAMGFVLLRVEALANEAE